MNRDHLITCASYADSDKACDGGCALLPGATSPDPTRDAAVENGRRVARKFFERRSMGRGLNAGPLVEVHISEEVFAGMLAIAFEHGAEWMAQFTSGPPEGEVTVPGER